MGKISFSQLILEKLNEAGNLALDGLFPRNRAEGRLWRNVLGLPTSYELSARKFSVILSKLKNQGLVAKSGGHKKSFWSLTTKGENKLKFLKTLDDIEPPKPDGVPRLVMFDIPEPERKKRNWLRTNLVAANFKQLQKSVWLGYNPLPESFIKMLDELKLKDKIHIVSINKSGTLGEI